MATGTKKTIGDVKMNEMVVTDINAATGISSSSTHDQVATAKSVFDYVALWWNSIMSATSAVYEFVGKIKATGGFEGDLTGNVTGNLIGNASSASKLNTKKTIQIKDYSEKHAGVAKVYAGDEDIILTLPETMDIKVEGSVGKADEATKLSAAQNFSISGATKSVSFNGTNSVELSLPDSISATFTGDLTGDVTGNVTGDCRGSSGSCTGNAATATKLETQRTFKIQDNAGEHTEPNGVMFDGSGDVTLKLPDTIKATIDGNCTGSSSSCSGTAQTAITADSCTGNAATATKWAAAKKFKIQDDDGTNTGSEVSVTGGGDGAVVLKLPATIKATIAGTASGNLPLSGGEMTGTIVTKKDAANGAAFAGDDNNKEIALCGGAAGYTGGGSISLIGKGCAIDAGAVRIGTYISDDNKCTLSCYPSGSLMWGTQEVVRKNSDTGKLVYGSGGTGVTAAEVGALSTSGGTMSGCVSFPDECGITNINNTGWVGISGGASMTYATTGARLYVYGKDNTVGKGSFGIDAYDGTNVATLKGYGNGSLTWNGANIVRSISVNGGTAVAADVNGKVNISIETSQKSPLELTVHEVTFENKIFTAPARGWLIGTWAMNSSLYLGTGRPHTVDFSSDGITWTTLYKMHGAGTSEDKGNSIGCFSFNLLLPQGMKMRYTVSNIVVLPTDRKAKFYY